MRRNYPALLSVLALAIGFVLPMVPMLLFPDQAEAFMEREGPGMLWLIIFWVGGWAAIGFFSGVAGLIMSFRGFRGRTVAILGTIGNLYFLGAQISNLGIF